MVNALDEGWMRVSSIVDSGAGECVARATTYPHIPFAESPWLTSGPEHREEAAMHFGRKLNTQVKHGAPGGVDFDRQAM